MADIIQLESAQVNLLLLNLLGVGAKKDLKGKSVVSNVVFNRSVSDFTLNVDPKELKASLKAGAFNSMSVDFSLDDSLGADFSKSIPVTKWTRVTFKGRKVGQFMLVTCEVMAGQEKLAEVGGGLTARINSRELGDALSRMVPGLEKRNAAWNPSAAQNYADCIQGDNPEFCVR